METNSINSFLVLITGDIDNFMYTYILVALLVFTGIYFTIRTKGVQFRYIKDMFTQLFEKKVDKNGKAISSFQAMMVSTGSRVGTGNIAGIATALAMGGPGALFWMWVMALIGGASAFIESTLAQIFKIRGKDGQFRGGPAYYIQQGLGKRWMGIVFAVSLIACYVVGFNELQAYNAASGLEYYIPDYATNGAAVVLGVVFTIATAAVIFGGQKRISVINSWVVPIMALAYIGLGVWITFSHLNLLPAAFGMMFASAFDFQAIFGGFAGSALMLGIKRGLFSNEAGMGSAPNAAATASVSHPAKQGLVQTLSVYIDTLFICTCSAMIVLVFMVQDPQTAAGLNGMPLVQMAVYHFAGDVGIAFITAAVLWECAADGCACRLLFLSARQTLAHPFNGIKLDAFEARENARLAKLRSDLFCLGGIACFYVTSKLFEVSVACFVGIGCESSSLFKEHCRNGIGALIAQGGSAGTELCEVIDRLFFSWFRRRFRCRFWCRLRRRCWRWCCCWCT